MKLILACVIMAGAMNAQSPQEINGATDAAVRNAGVFLSGSADAPFITNQSTKPVIGYVFHQVGVSNMEVLLWDVLTKDNPGIQPGESRAYKPMAHYVPAAGITTEAKKVSLDGVLFGDGQWIGSNTVHRETYKHRLEVLKAFGDRQTYEDSTDTIVNMTHKMATGMVEGARRRGDEEEARRMIERATKVPELWEEK